MVCLSAVVVPVMLDTNSDSTHLLRQWVRLYHYGHIYMPAVCVGTCGLYAYTAWTTRRAMKGRQRGEWAQYAWAGLTTFAMVPFTWLVMTPTNNTLFRLEALAGGAASVAGLEIVQQLVVRWGWLHLARSAFPLLGALLGLIGVLKDLGS